MKERLAQPQRLEWEKTRILPNNQPAILAVHSVLGMRLTLLNIWKLRLWASLSDYLPILCIIQAFSTKIGNASLGLLPLTPAYDWLFIRSLSILLQRFYSASNLVYWYLSVPSRFCCGCLTFDLLIYSSLSSALQLLQLPFNHVVVSKYFWLYIS